MRQNLPVTQQEYEVADGVTLMSTTDKQGNITYANAAFLQVSGFTAEEVIGKSHNIVRHPDMPPAAFADMWYSLKRGRSWSALVKNRRKNGDHYWVRANATPVVRDGEVIGYMSVRTKPTRAEIAEADALYRAINEGRAKHLRLYRGFAIRKGMLAWMSWLKIIPARMRLYIPIGMISVFGLAASYAMGVAVTDLLKLASVSAVMTAVVLVWLDMQFVRPIKRLQVQAQQVAAGQQGEVTIHGRIDEVGLIARSINQAGLNMRSLVDDVVEQIAGVRHVADEIVQGNLDLSERTEVSTSNLQVSAQTMEKMAVSLHQSAQAARDAAQLAQAATSAAAQGEEAIGRVVETMADIASASRRISDIIEVIDGIAFQTNILALNASVEAARAGVQGKGFAVVAEEVRSLALRSATAAKEISAVLMENSRKVDVGNDIVTHSGKVMHDIMEEIGRVDKLIAEISVAVSEQAGGMEEVNSAMSALGDMTRQNSALTEQSLTAADGLKLRSVRLADATDVFHAESAGRQEYGRKEWIS